MGRTGNAVVEWLLNVRNQAVISRTLQVNAAGLRRQVD